MDLNKQNKIYTAQDFERYHSGKMSEAEMHTIEKAALQDPFLSDALDGYALSNTPLKDTDDLRTLLFSQRAKKTTRVLFSNNYRWLKVAAMFILVAGITLVTYTIKKNSWEHIVAKNENRYSRTDSNVLVNKNAAPLSDTHMFNDRDSSNQTAMDQHPQKNSALQPAEKDKVLQKSVIENDEVVSMRDMRKQQSASVNEKNIINGKITDTSGIPIAYATINISDQKRAVMADSTGRFKVSTSDSVLKTSIAAVGYKTKQAYLKDTKDEVIVLEAAPSSLNEVVVTAMEQRRSKKELGYATKQKNKADIVLIDHSRVLDEPVDGWDKFNEYIQNKFPGIKDHNGKEYKGKVLLSFEVNKKGKAKNVQVEDSDCILCNVEALRLIENSPKWKHTSSGKNFLTLTF